MLFVLVLFLLQMYEAARGVPWHPLTTNNPIKILICNFSLLVSYRSQPPCNRDNCDAGPIIRRCFWTPYARNITQRILKGQPLLPQSACVGWGFATANGRNDPGNSWYWKIHRRAVLPRCFCHNPRGSCWSLWDGCGLQQVPANIPVLHARILSWGGHGCYPAWRIAWHIPWQFSRSSSLQRCSPMRIIEIWDL